MALPQSFIQSLIARVDVAEIVGRHVELKKAGSVLRGLCPFHGESSPSFVVTPSRGTYHCFGCGAHGDALQFLVSHTGVSFPDAVRGLAREIGVAVPSDDAPRARPATPGPIADLIGLDAARASARRCGHVVLAASRQAAQALRDSGIEPVVALDANTAPCAEHVAAVVKLADDVMIVIDDERTSTRGVALWLHAALASARDDRRISFAVVPRLSAGPRALAHALAHARPLSHVMADHARGCADGFAPLALDVLRTMVRRMPAGLLGRIIVNDFARAEGIQTAAA